MFMHFRSCCREALAGLAREFGQGETPLGKQGTDTINSCQSAIRGKGHGPEVSNRIAGFGVKLLGWPYLRTIYVVRNTGRK